MKTEKNVQVTSGENQIVVYQPNKTIRLDVRLENETVWLNRHQMAQLFGRDVKTIGKHIANALSEELACSSVAADSATTQSQQNSTSVKFEQVEVPQNPTVANFATVQQEGGREVVRKVEYYSLDVILSVGYRVKSVQGILFRRWANTVLKEYLLRGYSVNTRLNQLEDKLDRRLSRTEADVAELKDKVDFFVQTQTPPSRRRTRPYAGGPRLSRSFGEAALMPLHLVRPARRAGRRLTGRAASWRRPIHHPPTPRPPHPLPKTFRALPRVPPIWYTRFRHAEAIVYRLQA